MLNVIASTIDLLKDPLHPMCTKDCEGGKCFAVHTEYEVFAAPTQSFQYMYIYSFSYVKPGFLIAVKYRFGLSYCVYIVSNRFSIVTNR